MTDELNFIDSFHFENQPESTVIEIGGISIKINTTKKSISDFTKTRYNQFLSVSDKIDYEIDIFLSPGLIFHSPNPDEDFFNRQNFDEKINFIYSNGYSGYLSKKTKKSKVIVSDYITTTWVEHFLRFAFSWMALEANCLFFHGAGIIRENTGYVFFGPSNVGKTTITEFSTNYSILGDDMIMLKKNNGNVDVYATPFNINMGDLKLTNDKEQIKGFYRLRQDKTNYINKMNRTKAIAELMSSVPLSKNNSMGNIIAFSLCSEIAENVPCYDLHFTRDDSFWRLINGTT